VINSPARFPYSTGYVAILSPQRKQCSRYANANPGKVNIAPGKASLTKRKKRRRAKR
jgi:hypothetical protein